MENKKTKIISIASIIALALTLVTATYAYFMAQTGEGKSTDIKINANTVDTFTFEAGSALNLSLNQENFASGKGNQTGTTFAKAMLTANNKTNTATEHYYLYLNISNNTFTYSIDENTPEILLSIKDGSNNEITTLTGLTYKTVTDGKGATLKGFDITTKTGLITILNNREITTTSSKTEEWNVTVTFVNYNSNQAGNAGKNFSAKLMIQKEKIPTVLSDVCTSGNNLATCITTLSNKSESSIVNIYHHTSSLANGAGDNSYRYAGGDYVLTSAGKATGATMMIGYNNTVTTALIDFYCNGTKQFVGYVCDAPQAHYYLIKGDTIQYQTYKETLNKAVEKGYLTKDNVKNFVCFGSDASTCPTENLYRIIGVFNNQVKLIKYDYAKSSLLGTDGDFSKEVSSYYFSGEQGESPASNSLYYWNNATSKNTWSDSNLNKVNLNTNFINNIGSEWAKKIAITTWKVGGNTTENILSKTPSVAYQNEITNAVTTNTTDGATEYSAKIGLMYVSDYYYAAGPSAWTLVGNNSDATKDYRFSKGENWLYEGGWDWTISRRADHSYDAFVVDDDGAVGYNPVNLNNEVRPSFSLLSSTTYVSGTGSQSDPIRIN